MIVKLGGSVLTDKSRYRTPRIGEIARLAHELASCAAPLVVVHGAGSYGHVLAKQHRLAQGGGTALDAARVHADVRELGLYVLRALQDAGRPAVWLSTLDLAGPGGLDTGPALDALACGMTPILSGDVVLRPPTWTILSGDVLMVDLARELRPSMAVFVTDVDGIYDRDPREPGATLLSEVGASATAGGSPHADITGGMAGKLARARDVAAHAPVRIVNGTAPGRLAELLQGKDVVGTVVR